MGSADSNRLTKKMSTLWLNTDIETLETAGQKYVLLSDTHLADGGQADDSRNNEQVITGQFDALVAQVVGQSRTGD